MGFDQNLRLHGTVLAGVMQSCPGGWEVVHKEYIFFLNYCTYICKSDTKQHLFMGVFGCWKHTFLYEFFAKPVYFYYKHISPDSGHIEDFGPRWPRKPLMSDIWLRKRVEGRVVYPFICKSFLPHG